MQSDIPSLIAAIEKQADLFRELETALLAARSAYASRNLEQIYVQLERQESLCDRLRVIRSEIKDLQLTSLTGLAPELERRLHEGSVKLVVAQHAVRRLNAEQQAFLAGSLRTLRAMNNAFSNLYHTYDHLNASRAAVPVDAQS